ncbi:MAG TPA: hemerythrin domain-containing protein [Candidatus Binataceae bacterium]|nr:hemerythrin domain-containing protein [Candidatus Binataceae bacterium]
MSNEDIGSAQGPIYRLLAGDHVRLDRLLDEAAGRDPAKVEPAPYDAFRRGLLKHIGMEEKILLPAAQQLNGGQPVPVAARLRLDHGAIAALLVPSPTPRIIAALKTILAAHNALEEGAGGLYEECDRLAQGQTDALLERLRNAPEVPAAPHNDGPKVIPAARRALTRAGYEVLLIGSD